MQIAQSVRTINWSRGDLGFVLKGGYERIASVAPAGQEPGKVSLELLGS